MIVAQWRAGVLALLAALTLAADAAAQTTDGQRLAKSKCAQCHRADGTDSAINAPRLTGLAPAYLEKQLKAFAEGRRRSDEMTPIATELSEEDGRNVAKWYAQQRLAGAPRAPAANPKLAETGRRMYEEGNGHPDGQPCATCHQPDAVGNARFPRLAGQSRTYLARQLTDFKTGRRTTDAQMTVEAQTLSDQDIRALSEYLSSL